MKQKKILKIINYTLFILFLILLLVAIYIKKNFSNVTFEQILYGMIKIEGTNNDVFISGVIYVITALILIFIIMFIINITLKHTKYKPYLIIFIKNKRIEINIFKNSLLKLFIFNMIFILVACTATIKLLKIDEYIKNQFDDTKIFDNYYVDSSKVKFKFPGKRRNLIYIYVESLEMTAASKTNGGGINKSYIPKLEQIALSNINFSNNNNLGGAYQVTGTSWTASAMVAQTSGVPLKIAIDGNSYYGYGDSLPGIYNLGDILSDNSYKNYLMLGSNATFGGRRDYFKYHGDYTIYDYLSAKSEGLIDPDYNVWWGYEDKKLYSFAKEKLLKVSQKSEPFNFTLLTADTHFYDGYLDSSCPKPYDNNYANSFNCTDIMLSSFISWIKNQDFYKNTTVIVVGDHLTMQSNFYDEVDQEYKRTIYNTIINSPISTTNSKNRQFSSFDMFPTTLATLGVEINGDKLGLGTNLFSNKKTIVENLGIDFLNKELNKKSFYYDNKILKDTYYKMKK